MTAREYLQQIQLEQLGPDGAANLYDTKVRAAYLNTMAAAKPDYRKLLQDNLDKRLAFEGRYKDRLPSQYQSLQDYVRLVQAKEAIDLTLTRVGQYQPRENLVMGSVESEELNALSAYWQESGEFLIVFNRGLLLALLATANLIVCSLTPNMRARARIQAGLDNAEPIDSLDATIMQELAPRFAKILAAVSEGHAPDLEITIPLLQWPEKEIRWTKLEDAAMQFVFAHEYAHVLRGHVSTSDHLTEDRDGWGNEYEADSLALDFVVQTWMAELQGNPGAIAFAMQGVCLFFGLLSLVERYSAEARGASAMLWDTSRSHPAAFVRWLRMIDKARSRIPDQNWWMSIVAPQLVSIQQSLSLFYSAAVPSSQVNPAGIEWRLQRAAMDALGKYHLVPPHLFIAMRCARAALATGAMPDDAAVMKCAQDADAELKAAGARPLLDYRSPLAAVARDLSQQALADAPKVGAKYMQGFVNNLADAFLLDARTRFPSAAA